MSTPGTVAPGSGALELPPFSLDVQALDLGGDVKAVGLELIETQNRKLRIASRYEARMPQRSGQWSSLLWRGTNHTPSIFSATSNGCGSFARRDRSRSDRQPSAASCYRSQVKNNCGKSSNASRAKHSASERARHRNPPMLRSKAICQSAGWTPTRRPMPGTRFAPSASRRTAG
jgi:hypothetical protein